jgi:hypothetical protein
MTYEWWGGGGAPTKQKYKLLMEPLISYLGLL